GHWPPVVSKDIVATKWAALEGTIFLAESRAEILAKRFPSWLIREAVSFKKYLSTEVEQKIACDLGIKDVYDVGNFGIFGALWELAENACVGIQVDLKKIPIRQETVEICNFLDINPYEYLSKGMLLLICDNSTALIDELNGRGVYASVIGSTTDNNDRIVINKDRVRYLTPVKRITRYSGFDHL
ncbi:MAG: AIR synthase-related protein, partial [Lachnospiraceae bacterium]|nr:AIR synthase-related protein [Lachnospiraceae bacterium]